MYWYSANYVSSSSCSLKEMVVLSRILTFCQHVSFDSATRRRKVEPNMLWHFYDQPLDLRLTARSEMIFESIAAAIGRAESAGRIGLQWPLLKIQNSLESTVTWRLLWDGTVEYNACCKTKDKWFIGDELAKRLISIIFLYGLSLLLYSIPLYARNLIHKVECSNLRN